MTMVSQTSGTQPIAARPYIGGQALLEGVMMRSPHSFAIVCRRKSGELVVRERPIADERKGLRALPFVRGMVTLVESLKLGSEALKFSAALYEQDIEAEEQEAAKKAPKPGITSILSALSLPIISLATSADGGEPGGSVPAEGGASTGVLAARAVTILFAIGLFIIAPQAAANGISRLFHFDWDIRSVPFSATTGLMKLAIVVGYLSIIRRVPDIRRVFQYHGAEHKTISTYEAQEDLVVANARSKTTLHPRCGTTFLVMVAMVSVVVFSAIGPLLPHVGKLNGIAENLLLIAMKLPFLPVIAGITFELQRIFARYCTTGPLRVVLWPGFLVQKITTIEPDDDQLEVALASLRTTLWRELSEKDAPEAVTEKRFASYDDFRADNGYADAALARGTSSGSCSLFRSSTRSPAVFAKSRRCSARKTCSRMRSARESWRKSARTSSR